MSRFQDFHLEMARYFERPESQRLMEQVKLLYGMTPEEGYLMAQRFPLQMFPFATEENWEKLGRQVVHGDRGKVEMPDGRVMYSIHTTAGKEVPKFPTDELPPPIPEEQHDELWEWLEGLRKADGLGLQRIPTMYPTGGYNHASKDIIIPYGPSKEMILRIYLYGYITSLLQIEPTEIDPEDMVEFNLMLHIAGYKIFRDQGWDGGQYAKDTILVQAESFENYLEVQDKVDEVLSYFEDPMAELEREFNE